MDVERVQGCWTGFGTCSTRPYLGKCFHMSEWLCCRNYHIDPGIYSTNPQKSLDTPRASQRGPNDRVTLTSGEADEQRIKGESKGPKGAAASHQMDNLVQRDSKYCRIAPR